MLISVTNDLDSRDPERIKRVLETENLAPADVMYAVRALGRYGGVNYAETIIAVMRRYASGEKDVVPSCKWALARIGTDDPGSRPVIKALLAGPFAHAGEIASGLDGHALVIRFREVLTDIIGADGTSDHHVLLRDLAARMDGPDYCGDEDLYWESGLLYDALKENAPPGYWFGCPLGRWETYGVWRREK